MMKHWIIVPLEYHCTFIKRNPENNYFRKITSMDFYQRTSIKTKIRPTTYVLLGIKLLSLFQKWNHSDLKNHMIISTLWKIYMKILILLIDNNKTYNMLRLNKNYYLKTQVINWSLKKKYNIFIQTLTTIFRIQQRTQVSWQFIIMIKKIFIDYPEDFSNITDDS